MDPRTKAKMIVGVAIVLAAMGILGYRAMQPLADEDDLQPAVRRTRSRSATDQQLSRPPTETAAVSEPVAEASRGASDESGPSQGMVAPSPAEDTSTGNDAGGDPHASDKPTLAYHETYDVVVGIVQNIEQVLGKIEGIKAEMDRLVSDWKLSLAESGREPTDDDYMEVKTVTAPLWQNQQELNGKLNASLDKLDVAVPGAVRRESVEIGEKEGVVYTEDVVRIDYEHIRSTLGAAPEEYDIYLADFAESFSHMSGGK